MTKNEILQKIHLATQKELNAKGITETVSVDSFIKEVNERIANKQIKKEKIIPRELLAKG